MSRNKTIKLMHDFTGRTYKDCRAELKAHHWNLYEVLGSSIALNTEMLKQIEKVGETVAESMKAFGEALAHFVDVLVNELGKNLEPFIEGNTNDITVIDDNLPDHFDSK